MYDFIVSLECQACVSCKISQQTYWFCGPIRRYSQLFFSLQNQTSVLVPQKKPGLVFLQWSQCQKCSIVSKRSQWFQPLFIHFIHLTSFASFASFASVCLDLVVGNLKTRYSGHLLSRLARSLPQHDQTNAFSYHMKGKLKEQSERTCFDNV